MMECFFHYHRLKFDQIGNKFQDILFIIQRLGQMEVGAGIFTTQGSRKTAH